MSDFSLSWFRLAISTGDDTSWRLSICSLSSLTGMDVWLIGCSSPPNESLSCEALGGISRLGSSRDGYCWSMLYSYRSAPPSFPSAAKATPTAAAAAASAPLAPSSTIAASIAAAGTVSACASSSGFFCSMPIDENRDVIWLVAHIWPKVVASF